MTYKLPEPDPTRAAIVDKIEEAQRLISNAMDMAKVHGLDSRGGPWRPLDQAYAWLQQANRRARSNPRQR
jgi:hypothetical protein